MQFVIDGKNRLIAESFEEYFSNMGERLANKIPRNNEEDYFQYLDRDLDHFSGSFTFSSVTHDRVGAVVSSAQLQISTPFQLNISNEQINKR